MNTEKTYTIFFAIEGIANLFTEPNSDWLIGGAEIQMYYLAKLFASKDNCKVVFLSEQEDPTMLKNGIEIRKPLKPIERGLPYFSRKINDERKSEAFGFDTDIAFLIISNNEERWIINGAREAGIPAILRINGDSLIDGGGLIPRWTQVNIDSYINHSDGIVVQSNKQQNLLESRYQRKSKVISSIAGKHLGVDSGHHLDKIPNSALWVGRIDPIKRPWLLPILAQLLPEMTFVAAVHDRLPTNYSVQILHDLERQSNVKLHKSLNIEQISDLNRRVDIAINTSSTEGVPNTLIEAALNKVPFVALDVDPAETLSSNACGLTAQGDFNVFVELLRDLNNNQSLRRELGDSAFNYANETWTGSSAIEGYLEYGEKIYLESGIK